MAVLYALPDFSKAVELDERIRATPREATVKGMFMQSLADELKAVGAPARRYLAFKDYPYHDWLRLVVEVVALAYPRLSPREGMRRLGGKAYPTFVDSTIGKVLMSVAGSNLGAALRLVPRIYAVSGSVGTAEVDELGDARAVVRLRGVWDWVDAWHIGVFEGGIRAFRKEGTVRIHQLSICDADLELVWR